MRIKKPRWVLILPASLLFVFVLMPITLMVIFFGTRWYWVNADCPNDDVQMLEASVKNELIAEGENISGLIFQRGAKYYDKQKKTWSVGFQLDNRFPSTGYVYCTGEVTIVDVPLLSPSSSVDIKH